MTETKKSAREAKLAKALRANLKRRKVQARSRDAGEQEQQLAKAEEEAVGSTTVDAPEQSVKEEGKTN